MYKINEVAKLANVSVRTLHHYDKIGLLKPANVGENGYRYYNEEDFATLQQILFFKELDFSLQDIKKILENPFFNRKKALSTHKELLIEKKDRLEKMIESIDRTINAIEGGTKMAKKDMFGAFDMKKIEEHQKKYEQEVKDKYGDTLAYKQSQEKTKSYQAEDWKRIQERMGELYGNIAELMDKGPDDEEVQSLISEYRQYITDNFYDCTVEIFRGLGDLYVHDPRFTKNIDKVQTGLSEFLREAMHVYCDAEEGE
ncbi:MerR family transcriptional regulator [Priestia taiwanensis]|uniref:MerR family transcriptional regulator n=1 Tax=Priestia taiwanensis TaxID=1347902 RepID=A0A917ALT5_9BACI|nr:MerR family transcriptional regulator [Priestia taiwanensis]MBM7362109.1 DNA-binding transcriptional MerR regulator [Priestia taiwanensis]GGE59548.1 MerR family transcriptional regulator [Priestia taiwanensis]